MHIGHRRSGWPSRTLLLVVSLLLLVGCSSENRDWDAARKKDTAASYQSFLQKHARGKHSAEARQRIESLDWRKAESEGTPEAFRKFLQEHPSGNHLQAAKARLESLDWQKAEAEGTPEAFRKFLEEHPSGSHAQAAGARLDSLSWAAAKKANTIKSFEAYLGKYPKGQFASKARASLAALRPIRGNLVSFLRMTGSGGIGGTIVWALKAGKQEYQLRLSPDTKFAGLRKAKGQTLRTGDICDVNGRIVSGSQISGIHRTILVTRIRYVGR